MASLNPVLIDIPMPIRTPRLVIRPKQIGDGASTSAAVAETWDELHKWMRWAENREAFTAESMEIRNRQVMASFILRESIELIGFEAATVKQSSGVVFMTSTGKATNATPDTGSAKAPKAKGLQPRQQMPWCVMPSVRSECGESGSRTHVVMRQADASLKNSASRSRVSREVRIYFPAERVRTGIVTLDSMSLDCPTWR